MVWQMNLMTDEKEQKAFLSQSGYRTIRKRMLCSCTLKTFFELLESKLPNEDHMAFATEFIRLVDDELVDVSMSLKCWQFEERVEKMIRLLENESYYTSHDDELNKKEKEQFEAATVEPPKN